MANDYVDIISMNLNDPNLKPVEGGFQAVEPGTYEFEITKQSTGTSQAGNNVLKITGQVVAPEGNPMMGRTMMNSYLIKPDDDFARGRMLQFLTGAGAAIDQNGGFSRESLIGLRFTADVEKRAGKGVDKMGNEVDRDFTSWVRERPSGSDAGQQAAPSAPAKAAQQAAPPSNAPRRPQTPNGNGARTGR